MYTVFSLKAPQLSMGCNAAIPVTQAFEASILHSRKVQIRKATAIHRHIGTMGALPFSNAVRRL